MARPDIPKDLKTNAKNESRKQPAQVVLCPLCGQPVGAGRRAKGLSTHLRSTHKLDQELANLVAETFFRSIEHAEDRSEVLEKILDVAADKGLNEDESMRLREACFGILAGALPGKIETKKKR